MSQKINLTKHIVVVCLIFLTAMVFVSCDKYTWDPPKIDPTIPVSFKDEILPIFSQCTGCHYSGSPRKFIATTESAYTSIIDENLVNTGAPLSSEFLAAINKSTHPQLITEIEKQKIIAWITQGAKNN